MSDQAEGGKSILSGIRIVEVATYIFAPGAATVMSDFGAEVTKIEPPGVGDTYRYLAYVPPMPVCDANYLWILDGRNKKSIALDLKQDAAREIVYKLVREADVFVTNFRRSVLSSLKLRYEDLHPLNERLIYAQASGYGEAGDEVEKPGYDMTAYWARSGLMDAVANADGEPTLSLCGMGDHPSAMAMLSAILLALYNRERTGKGTRVSSSLMANGAWANSCLIQAALCGAEPYQKRTRSMAINPIINHYVTRDGRRFILCGVQADKDWPKLCRALDMPELLDDPRFTTPALRTEHRAELIAIIDRRVAEHDMAYWQKKLGEHQVVFGPAPPIADVPDDEQMQAAGIFVELDHPRHGRLRTVNSPIWVDGVDKRPPQAAPEIGQDTVAVLESLGYDEQRIADLIASGVAAHCSNAATR